MTYNKVFEVFQDYLSEDKDTEVLNTSRGYLVVMWETSDGDWVTSRLAEDPEDLRDLLQERYVDFHSFQFSNGNFSEVGTEIVGAVLLHLHSDLFQFLL